MTPCLSATLTFHGLPAFSGNTSAMVFDAILRKAPASPARLNPNPPVEPEQITNIALEKDRKLRYQSASEVGAHQVHHQDATIPYN